MATSPAGATPSTAIDRARLSVVLATPQSGDDEPGRGAAFSPANLAAGRLVHCHSTKDSVFLCAFANSLTGAVMSTSVPGDITSYTNQPRPTFWWVNPNAGKAVAASDRGAAPGLLYSQQAGFSLLGGASNGGMVHYLGVLNGVPLLVTYRTDKGTVDFITSDWLPNTVPTESQTGTALEAVVWNKGITYQGGMLYLVGARVSDNALFLRKIDLARNASFYLSDSGWASNARFSRPLKYSDGTLIKSIGPVSLTIASEEWYLSVVNKPSTNAIATFARTRHPLTGWRSLPQTVNLGSSANSTTTGVFFQPALEPNPTNAAIAPVDYISGIPYTYTLETATALRTSWGLLPTPRQRL